MLVQKLKRLKDELRVWSKNTFGNIEAKLKEANENLCQAQILLEQDSENEMLQNTVADIEKNIDKLLNQQDMVWK